MARVTNDVAIVPSQAPPSARAACGRGERLDAAAGRVSEYIGRHAFVLVMLFSIAYAGATGYRASRKLFWFDELYTVYLSRLPDLDSLWRVLLDGVDFNPPLFYLLTKLSGSLVGESHLGARLPEIVGVGAFCLCLFRFVSRRSSALGGCVSMLFPLVTTAYWYAYEARPHGLVIGCAGLALVCWQAAAAPAERRWPWLMGLGAALACGPLMHAFGVLLFVPIAFGEFARARTRGRADWPLWGTLAVSSAPAMLLVPLYRMSETGLPAPTRLPTLSALLDTYQSTLSPAVMVLAGTAVLVCTAHVLAPRRLAERSAVHAMPSHETAALLACMALPVFACVLAGLVGTNYYHRYGLSFIAGFAGLLGMAAARRPAIGLGILLLLAGQIGRDFISYARATSIREPSTSFEVSTNEPAFLARYAAMAAAPDANVPIVLLEGLESQPTFYYAPADVASRLVYVDWEKDDFVARDYIRLRNCCGAAVNAAFFSDFVSSHERFLVFGGPNVGLHVTRLIAAGAVITIKGMAGRHSLLEVTVPRKD
ncbi:MAG: hypothetical protein FJW23_03535 [Acidimicrobiia bacterium]|nr:hypothetical protein [Acidimicrobiia bacterium]